MVIKEYNFIVVILNKIKIKQNKIWYFIIIENGS